MKTIGGCITLLLGVFIVGAVEASGPPEPRELDAADDTIRERMHEANPGSQRPAFRQTYFVRQNSVLTLSLSLSNDPLATPKGEVHLFALDADPLAISTWFNNQGTDERSIGEVDPIATYPIQGIAIETTSVEGPAASDIPEYQRVRVRVSVPRMTVKGVFTLRPTTQELVVVWAPTP